MRFSLVNWNVAQLTAVILTVLTAGQSLAQQQPASVPPPDNKLEASGYLVQADREMECNPENARALARKALDTATAARERDPALIDTLADLKSQSNIKIADAEKRVEALSVVAKEASGLIKQARLKTAQDNINKADPKNCYSGFKSVTSDLNKYNSKAEAFVKRGDDVVDHHPKQAIQYYANAREINAEFLDLDSKTEYAQQVQSRLPKSHKVAGVVAVVLLLGLVGGLCYAASRIKAPTS